MTEQSDTINQQSLRGVGHYGPSGFRLVDRAYSSERPEAKIQNLKFSKQIDFHILIGYFIGQTRKNVEIPTH
jgi:hypothetical protein